MTFKNNVSYQLRDQTCVKLSLLGPGDRKQYLNGFERISARTNIDRFLTFKKGFTEQELTYLLAIDNINHLAIGAVDCKKPDIGIGLVRYVRLKKDPRMAEAAIIIIDEYQGKGLGSLLYRELMFMAAENKIQHLVNLVAKDNRGMLALLRKFDARQTAEQEHTYEFTIDLPPGLRKAG